MKLYKRLSLLLTMGIMGIGLITFEFAPLKTGAQAADEQVTQNVPDKSMPDSSQGQDVTSNAVTATPTSVPTVAPTPTPVPNNLEKVTDKALTDLVASYLDAKLSCDRGAFENIVTDVSVIDEESLQTKYGTVTGFDDITCYSKRGTDNIDYIIYYTYYMGIATLSSKAVSIDRLFVTTVDDQYRVFTGYVSEETQQYLDDINNDEDVQALISEAYEEMAREMEADENLLAYWMRMYNGSDAEDEELPDEIAGVGDNTLTEE